jgi:AcrR family transcriptional regulator
MPKQVDHEARRRQIADAVCRLVGEHGLEAVSLRHVAAEAGVSMGQVQHYFATKDEMLLFTFRTIGEHVEQRIAAAVSGHETPRAVLRALLVELLPLSEPARAEAPVLAAFLARAVVEPALARGLADGATAMAGFVAGHITGPDLDPQREARTLLALVDGLMLQLLTGQVTDHIALSLIDYHLDRIVG